MNGMRANVIFALAAAVVLASCGMPAPPDPPSLEWARRWPKPPPPPPPPPGQHDSELEKLPQPLSVADARRVLVEATIYAPWGFGLGGRPMQALAINVILDQPSGAADLENVYRNAALSGRLLALCGLKSADPVRYASLASHLEHSRDEVAISEGCTGRQKTAAEILSEVNATAVCTDIPRSKERIIARFKRAG